MCGSASSGGPSRALGSLVGDPPWGTFKFNGKGRRVRFYLSIIILTFISYMTLSDWLYKTSLLWVVLLLWEGD